MGNRGYMLLYFKFNFFSYYIMEHFVKGDNVVLNGHKAVFLREENVGGYRYFVTCLFENRVLEVEKETMVHAPLTLDFFNDKFLKTEQINEVYEKDLLFHFTKLDLSFWFKWDYITEKITYESDSGYSFEITTEKEVRKIFESIKIKL